ncbi:MAG: cytochrome c [Burkholderiales bacterium]|nr:cytochrome c [Burkholderiales bacterium]
MRRLGTLGATRRLALLLALACWAAPVAAGDRDRGRALYEARCVECHDTSVHRRESRKAQTFEAILAEVGRWNANTGGGWTATEIEDVAVYLNWRYYRLPCPESICGPRQASLPRGVAAR